MAVARGTGIASSNDRVPEAYCDAIAEDDHEAAEVLFQTNAARQMASVLTRHGVR